MYEEKAKKSIEINWKSLFIKLAILLIVVFVVLWIISLFKKDDNKSNFGTNIGLMRDAATEYFTDSKLPSDINEDETITLKEMYNKKLLVEFKDENGNSCDTTNSYAKITKIDEENYRLEVKLVCEKESDTIINTLKYKSDTKDEEINIDNNEDENIEQSEENTEDSISDNNISDKKPSNNVVVKPNSGNSTENTTKPSTDSSVAVKPNDKPFNNPSTNNTNNNNISNICNYGKNEYSTKYPLAYVVSGDCAVSYNNISGVHANNATLIGNKEYTKLYREMLELESETGVKLEIATPIYEKVMNTTNNGYVGYQIIFALKEKISTYGSKTIYSYYLDLNGNRTVIIDNRSSLNY